ncbi:MAG: prolyl oligopeptidase family serine peptidase [Acetobacteraceae bacterium]
MEAWAITPDAALLATVENDRGYSVLRVGPPGRRAAVVAGLPRGVVTDLAWSSDGTTLAFSASAPTEPPSLFLWRDGAARPAWRPEPTPHDFVDLDLVAWDSFDGTRIPGWFALPRTPKPAGGYPAVMWVHGGPESQTRANFRPDIQMLLAQGVAVLLPNVRGSTGYGRAYAASDNVERRLDSVTDLAHGRAWLAAHPAIDAERIGIMGQSYGGFMVMSAITEHPGLWRAAVNYYGIADFATLLAGTGPWRRKPSRGGIRRRCGPVRADFADPSHRRGAHPRADRARLARSPRADGRERPVRGPHCASASRRFRMKPSTMPATASSARTTGGGSIAWSPSSSPHISPDWNRRCTSPAAPIAF